MSKYIGPKKKKIVTTLGDGVLYNNDKVQVYTLGKDKPVTKLVGDLNPGDRILLKRNAINVDSVDDPKVRNALEKDPLYKHARSLIYDWFESEERNCTMMRRLLLEGLQQKGYIKGDNISRAISLRGEDLSFDQRKCAIDSLETLLGYHDEQTPVRETYGRWVDNKSVLTWNKYLPLLAEINPTLAEFSQEDGLRKKAYDFWRSIRQGIIKRLRHGSTNNGNGKEEKNHEDIRKTKPSVSITNVVNGIVEEFDDEYCIATVVSAPEKTNESYDDNFCRNLKSEDSATWAELARDRTAMSSLFSFLISGFLTKQQLSKEETLQISNQILDSYSQIKGINMRGQTGKTNPSKLSKEILDKILDGNFTDSLDQQVSTVLLRTMDTYLRLGSCFPNEFSDCIIYSSAYKESFGEHQKSFKRMLGHAQREFKRKTGVDFSDLTSVTYFEVLYKWYIIDGTFNLPKLQRNLIGSTSLGSGYSLINQGEDMQRMMETKELAEKTKQDILSRVDRETIIEADEMHQIFEKYDIQLPEGLILLDDFISGRAYRIIEEQLTSYKQEVKKREQNAEKYEPKDQAFLNGASEGHDRLLKYLKENPSAIEPGLTLLNPGEHSFEGSWARADLLYMDSKGIPLIVEVKQYAEQANGFANDTKAVSQMAGYTAALQAEHIDCPLISEQMRNARGMLIAHKVSDRAREKIAKLNNMLGREAFSYKEIDKLTVDKYLS